MVNNFLMLIYEESACIACFEQKSNTSTKITDSRDTVIVVASRAQHLLG